mmetsp:Transcript_6354/g.26336  ORF Transcript_6354/g.26336 Transcript_6354/m.26336 type:complete len:390 (-) Transcript_6354:112-1281(-)
MYAPLVEYLESAARGSINLGGEQVVAAHQTSHAPPHELVNQPIHRDVREVIREMHVHRRDRAPRLLRVDMRVRALLLLRRQSLKGFGAAVARVFLPEERRGDAGAFVPVRVAPVITRTQATASSGRHLASVPLVRSRALLPVLVPVETDNLGVVLDEELDDVVGASGVLGERRRVSLGAAQAQKERAKRGRDVPDASREGGGLVRVALRSRHPHRRVGLGAPSKKRGDGRERPLGADVEGVEQRSEGENSPGPRGHRRHREEGVVQAEGEKRLREGGEVELEHAGYGVRVGASLQRHHLAPVVPDAALLDLVVVSANFEHVLCGLDADMRIEPCDGLRDHSRQAAALPARILHADAEHRHRSSRAGGSPETLFLINTKMRVQRTGLRAR